LNSNQFTDETAKETIGNAMVNEFVRLAESLYKNGMKKFLSDRIHGDLGTFCSHVLHWYLLDIIRRVYTKYGLDPGIFTIEGFEATSFCTKQVLWNKCNHKGNVWSQTMVELVTEYITHKHSVTASLAVRQKTKTQILKSTKRIHH